MANTKPKPAPDADTEKPADKQAVVDDVAAARAELQAAADKQNEQGYFGTTADPFPNEAYSLETGPKSPTAAEVAAASKPTTNTKEG